MLLCLPIFFSIRNEIHFWEDYFEIEFNGTVIFYQFWHEYFLLALNLIFLPFPSMHEDRLLMFILSANK